MRCFDLTEATMRIRFYDDQYGQDNVISELRLMIRSHDQDARIAATKFYVAMSRMEKDGRSYGSAISLSLLNGTRLTPQAALRIRPARGHHLYFTFIKRPIAPQGEVRMLLAAADPSPNPSSVGTTAQRHNRMS